VATLFNVRSGNAGTDEPNQLAVPQQAQKQIPDLDYPLLTGQAPDQPIVLEVLLLIDNTGKPSVQRVLQGSGNLNDSQFVNELIQGWSFQPAYMGGGAVDSLLEVSIRVSPLSQ
jgi:outer membrane biosynthesis protein TonB